MIHRVRRRWGETTSCDRWNAKLCYRIDPLVGRSPAAAAMRLQCGNDGCGRVRRRPGRAAAVDDAEPPISFVVVARPSGGATVMVVGELAFDTVPIFRRRVAAMLDGGQGAPLELDLSAVEFCDAAGLTALQSVADTAAEEQLEVRITAASSCLDVLLELCQIPGLLGHTPSRRVGGR